MTRWAFIYTLGGDSTEVRHDKIGSAGAATVPYWQFETSPGFTADTVGGLTLAPTVGAPSQATLPVSGRNSTFPDAVASTL